MHEGKGDCGYGGRGKGYSEEEEECRAGGAEVERGETEVKRIYWRRNRGGESKEKEEETWKELRRRGEVEREEKSWKK